jgi:hypothetical protein
LAPLTDPTPHAVTFPDLNSPPFGGEAFSTNLIMPEPCAFISETLPACSIIRPTLRKNAGPLAVVSFLTNMGLFIGQSHEFFFTLKGFALGTPRLADVAGAVCFMRKRGHLTLTQVDRKLSMRVYMTVRQWRQRTAIVGSAHLRVVLNETFDHRCNLGIKKALVL